MDDMVKVSWSGGKDSTAAELLHLREGHYTKVCNYIPMFNDDIPLIAKRHHEFILNTAERFKSMGAEIYFAKGMTYWDFVLHKCTKGPRIGKIYGFPCFLTRCCSFKNYSKKIALDKLDVGYFDYEDIAIAYDESARHGQIGGKLRSILVEQRISEAMARQICIDNDMLSPHYEVSKRDGCGLCPQANPREREQWFADYPKAIELVRYLQDRVKEEYPEDIPMRYPLRNKEWFIDDDKPVQISIFD